MKRTLTLYPSLRFLTPANLSSSASTKHLSILRSLSTKTKPIPTPKKDNIETKSSNKDSFILEQFRQRKLQGSRKSNTKPPENVKSGAAEVVSENDGSLEDVEKVVSCFEELGLKEEMVMAAGDMEVWVPTEIQCLAVPAILDGKSVLLSSDVGSGRTLACLLPLIQLLRQDEAVSRMKPKHPRAIVLCSTTESSDEGYRVAKSISDFARLKSAVESGIDLSQADILNSPIGMLIGTPDEVVQQLEDRSVILDNIKYSVLDDLDAMLEHGFTSEINKIVTRLKNDTSSDDRKLQTVMTTSTLTKMLGKTDSMVRLEHEKAGKVTAMLLEMAETEVFDAMESSKNLKKKLVEAVESITTGS